MEADKFINSVEKYLREFVVYFLSFFLKNHSDHGVDPRLDEVNKTIIFSIASAAAGAYLWNRYIYDNDCGVHNVVGVITDTLLRWFSYGIFLYLLMRICKLRPHILLPILSTFKVLSVSHIIAAFCAYLVKNIFWYFLSNNKFNIHASENAAIVSYCLQFFLVFVYMPREIFDIVGNTGGRNTKIFIVSMFMLTTFFINGGMYSSPRNRTDAAKTITGTTVCAPGASK